MVCNLHNTTIAISISPHDEEAGGGDHIDEVRIHAEVAVVAFSRIHFAVRSRGYRARSELDLHFATNK